MSTKLCSPHDLYNHNITLSSILLTCLDTIAYLYNSIDVKTQLDRGLRLTPTQAGQIDSANPHLHKREYMGGLHCSVSNTKYKNSLGSG
jgi:hypothetical protein